MIPPPQDHGGVVLKVKDSNGFFNLMKVFHHLFYLTALPNIKYHFQYKYSSDGFFKLVKAFSSLVFLNL